jgi:hypothetical protein
MANTPNYGPFELRRTRSQTLAWHSGGKRTLAMVLPPLRRSRSIGSYDQLRTALDRNRDRLHANARPADYNQLMYACVELDVRLCTNCRLESELDKRSYYPPASHLRQYAEGAHPHLKHLQAPLRRSTSAWSVLDPAPLGHE